MLWYFLAGEFDSCAGEFAHCLSEIKTNELNDCVCVCNQLNSRTFFIAFILTRSGQKYKKEENNVISLLHKTCAQQVKEHRIDVGSFIITVTPIQHCKYNPPPPQPYCCLLLSSFTHTDQSSITHFCIHLFSHNEDINSTSNCAIDLKQGWLLVFVLFTCKLLSCNIFV